MTSQSSYTPAPAADFVLPFDIAPLGVRGRLVRLSDVSAQALTAHKLPEAAARVAAETLTLSALLGSALKLDGRMTVQTRSDGALDLIASDYYGAREDRPAGVRGYARVDEARAASLGNAPKFADLAGAGSLGITIEPRLGGETYQGIVELSPEGIAASAQTYFEKSEQLPTAIKLAAAPLFEPGKPVHWRSGGIMLQRTADVAKTDDAKMNDEWERLKMFIASVEDIELVDTALKAEDLLWRLFHEDEIRVLPFGPLVFRCDCSVDRIIGVLKSYTPEDRAKLADPDGVIRARCEFCGKGHEIKPPSP
jgi:molecular chaperone Hsp33